MVRELGFVNVAIDTLGVLSMVRSAWVLPAAIAGSIFYGLAGVNHFLHKGRNNLQNVAMVSDLLVAGALLAICLMMLRP